MTDEASPAHLTKGAELMREKARAFYREVDAYGKLCIEYDNLLNVKLARTLRITATAKWKPSNSTTRQYTFELTDEEGQNLLDRDLNRLLDKCQKKYAELQALKEEL